MRTCTIKSSNGVVIELHRTVQSTTNRACIGEFIVDDRGNDSIAQYWVDPAGTAVSERDDWTIVLDSVRAS